MSSLDIAPFVNLLGAPHVLTDPSRCEDYGVDATGFRDGQFCGVAEAVLLPASTAEVAAIAKHCHREGIPMVPSGGRTGLAAGATAAKGQVVIALERMNAIAPIDELGATVAVEAGVITQNLQDAAAAKGLHFAVDLAAKGSSQIGGNIATNAGGLAFIRYGGMREQVLGLEVVLADGTVLPMARSLVKDNSGYNLKQLFIGSEGTLGIITKATLRLWPAPAASSVALFALSDFAALTGLLQAARRCSSLAAFEFFDQGSLDKLCLAQPSTPRPFTYAGSGQAGSGQAGFPYYALIDLAVVGEGQSSIEDVFAPLLEVPGVEDAILATSSREYAALWRYRELLSESIAVTGQVKKNDVAVAIKDLAAFTADLESLGQGADVEVLLFGHIGDGNIHINYWADKAKVSAAQFAAITADLERQVEQLIQRYDGSMSAEHGIGLLKRHSLTTTRSSAELATMRALKHTLDPRNLLNPGKVLG